MQLNRYVEVQQNGTQIAYNVKRDDASSNLLKRIHQIHSGNCVNS